MKERLVTLSCALGALALFLTFFFHADGRGGGANEVPRPTTEVRSGNGYRAAMEWLDAEHVRTVSLRSRFNTLATQPGLAATGNILIVTLPAATVFRTEEFRPLDRWVRTGNTLLVLASLSDSPDWASVLRGAASGDLNLLTGMDVETVKAREARKRAPGRGPRLREPEDSAMRILAPTRRLPREQRGTLVASRPHPYFEGVKEAVAASDYPTQPWSAKVPYEGFVFTLGRERETGEGVFWTRPFGNGRIIVSGFGSIFTNRTLGRADNARLLSNIIGVDLGPGGAVLFDDVHQGLGSAYDPAKFYSDRRLHVTIGILTLVWLTWVLGGTKLRVPVASASAPREADLVRATGGFLARVLTPAGAALRMIDHLMRELTRSAPAGAAAASPGSQWEILERQSRIVPAQARQLKRWHEMASASKRVPLAQLHDLIVRIEKQVNQ